MVRHPSSGAGGAVVSRAGTKLRSGAIALFVGAVTFPVLVAAIVAGFARVGIALNDLGVFYAIVVSGWMSYEVFRVTFNALCERWSSDPVPPRIEGWRVRRNVVRTS